MSRKSSRKKFDFDYKLYSDTGEKVEKVRTVSKMTTPVDKLKIMSSNIMSDIDDFFETYQLELIKEESDLASYVDELKTLKREHRRIHTQLKGLEGDNFQTVCPDYEKQKKQISDSFTVANEELSKVRKTKMEKIESENEKRVQLEMEKLAQEKAKADLEVQRLRDEVENQKAISDKKLSMKREKVKCEFSVFEKKVHDGTDEILLNVQLLSDVEDMERLVFKFETWLENLDKIYADLSGVFIGEMEDFEKSRNVLQTKLKDNVSQLRVRIREIKADVELREAKKAYSDEQVRTSQMKQSANDLHAEIKTRYDTLLTKCDVNCDDLGDQEILNLKKREDHYHTELREIIEKITSYSQFVVSFRDEVTATCAELSKMRDTVVSRVTDLFTKIDNIILEKDISEKKLKNAAVLNIDLKKFKGYNSDVDIYTFKEEFKKLVEPNFPKNMLAEYLKKNYLTGSAYTLVAKMDKIDDIWEKLIGTFGNTQLLLQNKISSLEKFSSLEKAKDDEKIVFAISGLLNTMADLKKLASIYNLEGNLYYGGGLHKILRLIGEVRKRKFLKSISRDNLDDKDKWGRLETFLSDERIEREMFMINEKTEQSLGLNQKSDKNDKNKDNKTETKDSGRSTLDPKSKSFVVPEPEPVCKICDSSENHVVGKDKNDQNKRIEYFACEKFVNLDPFDRMKLLRKKGFCTKCLKPGVKQGPKHECDDTFVCKNPFKNKKEEAKICQLHVLVCGFHAAEDSNKEKFKQYKSKFVDNSSVKYESFSQSLAISFHVDSGPAPGDDGKRSDMDESKIGNSAIFMFQTIEVENEKNEKEKFNIFYDDGCFDACFKKSAIDRLKKFNRSEQTEEGPMIITGVGGHKSICPHGEYTVSLPLANGGNAKLSGLCLDRVTGDFPKYKLKNIESEFHREDAEVLHSNHKGNLPKLPDEVGGEVDIMIGTLYRKYQPIEVLRLASGLSLLRSAFKNVDSSDGVIAGPYPKFYDAERISNYAERRCEINPTVQMYGQWINLRNSVPLLGEKCETHPCSRDTFESNDVYLKRKPKVVSIFEDIEKAGTEVNYRCLDCRDCADCKKGPLIENISIQEEVEQQMIEKSVKVDFEKRESVATLPFLSDPDKALLPNYTIARKVYNGQTKKLSKRQNDRDEVIRSEGKLQDLGYVEYLDNLSEERRRSILESALRYHIPWRVVWNEKSITTAVRLVFDASQKTGSGISLNDLLAKGANVINSLIQILIRWKTKLYAFHTDITKMYNSIKLHEDFWRYQLYLWDKDLDPDKEPVLKVIKTLIYGVVPSGNQAIAALRKIADAVAEDYPEVSQILRNDFYVDDGISGSATCEERRQVTDDLKVQLEKVNISLKGYTFSGSLPDEKLSTDGVSIHVGGYKWFSEEDEISLGMEELNFSKRVRGRKDDNAKGIIPLDLTKRDCVSKVAECFSPTGIFVPLLGSMKLDISDLHTVCLAWDDRIPDNLRGVWESNFEMLNEMRSIRYNRAVVPPDAKSLDVHTIGFGDASEKLICACIYARFEKKDGSFSCQLIFARSKVVSEISPPRAELLAALLNATTGHVVERALGEVHKSTLKLTDSQVALHWICSKRTVLKPWVRNRVKEINRLSPASLFRHIDGPNMIADLGTRKGAKIPDILPGSPWYNLTGYVWASGPVEDFPVSTVEQVKLDNVALQNLKKEQIDITPKNLKNLNCKSVHVIKPVSSQVKARYEFSQYLLDPNKYRFRTVSRIFSLALMFIYKSSKNVPRVRNSKLFKHRHPGNIPKGLESQGNKFIVTSSRSDPALHTTGSTPAVNIIEVSDAMIQAAFYYYTWKASLELKQFVDRNLFSKITKEIDDVLYFSGRIPPDSIEGQPELWDVAIDLSQSSFCVPVMDRHCPVAYAIAMEVHWFHPDAKHNKGVESLLRATGKYAYIIGGRTLIKTIKHYCKMCRILHKQTIEAVMGPLQKVNLCIAPCFYACQADIFGPLKSYSNVNKRATIKVWFIVFCCCTTGAVDIRLMEDYSTDSFVLAFIRFSCRFGYPKWVLPDEGSQLVKGCKDMEYSFVDAQQRLSLEYGVEYKACPVGAHYVHGKVERKIQQIKKCLKANMKNERLSTIQWETIMQQIGNSINNIPIGVKNKVEDLENLDILTPNRLILGRNNNRCPNAPVEVTNDYKRIIEANANIFKAWFNAWLISYVPTLVERPKWHESDRKVSIGDVILFLKSEQEFDLQYQYGIVSSVNEGDDGEIRDVEIEYVNHHENIRRKTHRGVRDLVMISPIDELDLYHELSEMMI